MMDIGRLSYCLLAVAACLLYGGSGAAGNMAYQDLGHVDCGNDTDTTGQLRVEVDFSTGIINNGVCYCMGHSPAQILSMSNQTLSSLPIVLILQTSDAGLIWCLQYNSVSGCISRVHSSVQGLLQQPGSEWFHQQCPLQCWRHILADLTKAQCSQSVPQWLWSPSGRPSFHTSWLTVPRMLCCDACVLIIFFFERACGSLHLRLVMNIQLHWMPYRTTPMLRGLYHTRKSPGPWNTLKVVCRPLVCFAW